jgi:hypothetical protein
MLNDPLNIISLTGDGVQTVFDVPYKIWDVTELEVSVLTASGASTVVSDWTATISPSGLGGTVTYPTAGAPLPLGDKLVVRRVVPIQQKVDLIHANRVLPDVVENALDRLTAMVAQNAEEVDRAVKGAPGQTATDYLNELDADRAAAELAAQNAQAAQTAAEQAQTAAETAAGNAEASAIRAETAAEQAELPIASPGEEGKVLTVSPSLGPEWAEVPEELPPYSVADEGKVLKVSSLGETEWGMEEKELPSYTPLDAGKTLSVNAGGDAVEWTDPLKGSVNIAPQTIVRAQVGSRPYGWTVADCDAPVASLSHSGNVVAVEAGLQVAYADNGRVQLSEELAAPQTVDLSAAADGIYHIAVNMNADCSFSTPSYSKDYPQLVTRNLLAYPVPVAASTSASGREIPFSVDGDLATYWSPSAGSGTAIIGEWIECTLPDTKGGTKSVVAKATSAYAGSAPATADIEQQIDGVWTKVGAVKYLSNVLYGSFQATAGNATLRIKATAGTVSSSYGWTIADIQVSDLTAGDLYNPATVTMYDKDDNPIRRVYLGWVEKFGGTITDVHCYSLGDTTIVPVNNGANVSINSRYIQGFPYVAGGAPTLTSQIYFENKWGETGFIFSTAGLGTKATTIGEDLFFQTGSNSLTSLGTNAGSDFTVTTNTPTKGRIKVRRGY